MKCQHCGSDDIIAIQGRNYCLNCGSAVVAQPAGKAEKPVAAAAPAAPVAAATAVAAPLIDKPAKLPKPKKVKKLTKPKAVKVAKPKKEPKPKVTKEAPKVSAAVIKADEAKPAPTYHQAAAPQRSEVAHSHRRRAMDVQAPAPKRSGARIRSLHPMRFSLTVSAILAVVLGVAVSLSLWLQVDQDIALYVVVGGLVGVIISSVLAQSALVYGISRVLDGRPAPHAYWWAAARSGFMDVVNANVITLICLALLGIAEVALWRLGATLTPLPGPERLAILLAANLILIWLLLGVWVARRVAVPAVIVGGLPGSSGIRVGWRLYLKNGGHLLITGLEALLGRLVAFIVLLTALYWALQNVTVPSQPGVIIGSGVAAAITVFILAFVFLEWETRLWLRQYRRVVGFFAPAERVRLLTGRIQAKA